MSAAPVPERTRQLVAVFDRIAPGYDHPSLRFFPFVADHLVQTVGIRPGAKVLDLATGTGAVALAAAQRVGPGGRVTAVDLSEAMLARQQARIARRGIDNVELQVMDAAAAEFRSGYFDFALCSFGLFMLEDMEAALRQWLRVLRPGGMLAFTSFAATAMQPLAERFFMRLRDFTGVDGQAQAQDTWLRLRERGRCLALLEAAGAQQAKVEQRQFGYHLAGAEDWWALLWNSGFRGLLEALDEPALAQFRREHLAEIAAVGDEQGLWLDVPVWIATAKRAAQDKTASASRSFAGTGGNP